MAIRITFLEGPRLGETLVATPFLTPQDLLCGLSQYRHRWATDYTEATTEERDVWEKQDIGVRCVRALSQGLPVHLDDQTFRASDIAEAYQVAADIEELLSATSREAIITEDSADRIVITVR